MKIIAYIAIILAACCALGYFIIHKSFDTEPLSCEQGIELCELNYIKSMYGRVSKIGGEPYSSLLQRDVNFITKHIKEKGAVPQYAPDEIERLKKELKPVFWWAWWMKGDYIMQCYWRNCVFDALQQYNQKQAERLQIMYVTANQHAPFL